MITIRKRYGIDQRRKFTLIKVKLLTVLLVGFNQIILVV